MEVQEKPGIISIVINLSDGAAPPSVKVNGRAPGDDAKTGESAPPDSAITQNGSHGAVPATNETPPVESPAKPASDMQNGAHASAPAVPEKKDESPANAASPVSAALKDAPAKDDKRENSAPISKWHRFLKPAIIIGLLCVLAVAGYFIWLHFRPKPLGEGFASGNGRLEAEEFDVAAKSAGRVTEIYVDDGDSAIQGQVVARIDTDVLQTQLKQAQADEGAAQDAVGTARAVVVQREYEQVAAMATVTQREAQQTVADKTAQRTQILADGHASSVQELDNDLAQQREAVAGVAASKAQYVESQASIDAARAQVLEATSKVRASQSAVGNLRVQIGDTALKAARTGRVQFRIVQPGEVVAAGGKVISMVDTNNVTMTLFLPESAAGRLALGSEVHIVLDSSPNIVFPATVSFVDSVAQFTPKTVETQSEREKLVFRVKARIAPAILSQYMQQIKSGLPGMAYVRLDPSAAWPEKLAIRTGR